MLKDNDIIKIENFLPLRYFKKIEELFFDKKNLNNFPWFYIPNSTYFENIENFDIKHFSFGHTIFQEDVVKNNYFDFFSPILYFLPTDSNKNIRLLRIRAGLLTRVSENKIIDEAHVDFNFNHKTLLLYINDSDGDTIFYSDKYCKNIIFTNTPKKNSAIIFNGNIYHSSSHPIKNSIRIALNINFIEEDL
jgi:hypothetical protein